MRVERITVQACCGRAGLVLKIDRPITTALTQTFVDKGFTEASNFAKAGMLYVDNLDLIVTGSLGTDKLHVKCKYQDCEQKLNELEGLLLQME